MKDILSKAMECFRNHEWEKAEELFSQMENQKAVEIFLKKCRLFRKFSVGNTVSFGNLDGKELEWIVLEEQGNMRLLVSKEIVVRRPYQGMYIDTYWENSDLRKWLNQEFLTDAFSGEERQIILNSRIETPANADYYTNGGPGTVDRIFILSKPEVERYLPEIEQRDLGQWWWMRTPGSSLLSTSIVYRDGSFYRGGVNVHAKEGGVRPAMWLVLKG